MNTVAALLAGRVGHSAGAPNMHRSSILALAAGLLVLAAGAAGAENHGRLTQPHEQVTTSIFPEGDSDDVVFDAPEGWKLTAMVKVKGQVVLPPVQEGQTPPVLKPLLPVLELVDPDGNVTTDGLDRDGNVTNEGVVVKLSKKSAKLTVTLAESGRFALRMSGTEGTGVVALKMKLKPAKVATLKKIPLGPNTNTFYDFPARGGALLSWKLKFTGDGAVQVKKILDPNGQEIDLYDPADENSPWLVRQLTSEKVTDFPIPEDLPGGIYQLQVENKLYPSEMTLSIKVALPKLPAEFPVLTRVEPVLTDIGRSSSGCGVSIPLTGLHLDSVPGGVYFGDSPVLSLAVSQGATDADPDTINVVVPGGTGTVDVTYVAADGQQAVLTDAFTFLPPPVLTSFDPVFGPGVGNIDMTITGSGFEYPSQDLYKILVGGVQASLVEVIDANTITCRIPAGVSGATTVMLRDKCGEDVIAPGNFTYTTGLNISSVVPNAVPTFGNVPVTIFGTGFLATNEVFLDGNPIESTPISYSGTVIGHAIAAADLPAHAAGKVEVKVTQGPNQAIKANGLAYYEFVDVTDTAIPAATATDDWGGSTMAVVDRNGDGKTDYILLGNPTALSTTRPGLRVLQNNGSGVFSDMTATLLPEATPTEGLETNKILSGNFNTVDSQPDIYLSRPGTGTEARRTSDKKWVDAFGLMLFGYTGSAWQVQPKSGSASKLGITGTLTYSNCFIYNFDFRSTGATLGDLDGDLDLDIALVNETSIATFTGVNCNYRWQTCAGGYYAACYSFTSVPYGSALRFCTVSSSGTVFDRTFELLKTSPSSSEDFRGVAVAVGDMDADFLNDVLITHNTTPGGNVASCTRGFKQKNTAMVVSYNKFSGSFIPPPQSASDDDWRGDTLAIPDLNADLYRDLVVAYDGALPNGRAFSTRILIHDSILGQLFDRTDALLTGLLPAGDDGRAKAVYAQDLDKDGDADLILVTPGSAGAGNPQARFLLNIGKDSGTGYPIFMNATSILPITGSETGNGVAIASADIDGDGDQDLIVTDTYVGGETPVKRTRVWRQDR
jgi:hypothetical protein